MTVSPSAEELAYLLAYKKMTMFQRLPPEVLVLIFSRHFDFDFIDRYDVYFVMQDFAKMAMLSKNCYKGIKLCKMYCQLALLYSCKNYLFCPVDNTLYEVQMVADKNRSSRPRYFEELTKVLLAPSMIAFDQVSFNKGGFWFLLHFCTLLEREALTDRICHVTCIDSILCSVDKEADNVIKSFDISQ